MAPLIELLRPATMTVFDSLVRASVQGGIFILLVWLACRLWPQLPASVRCTLWWLASLKLVVAFVCVDPLPIPVLTPPAASSFAAVNPLSLEGLPPVPESVKRGAVASTEASVPEWPLLAAGVWAAIVILLMAALGDRMRKINRMARRAISAPQEVQDLAARLSDSLGIWPTPAVRISDDTDTPLVIGFRRPVVLLPAAPFAALRFEEQRMALCHELLHLRRKDLWLAYVPALAERLFFFHPLAHLAVREYQLTREAACDAAVIRELDARPGDYGRLLLALGVSRLPMHLAAAGSPSSYSKLKRRITMLRDIPRHTPRLRTAGWAVVLLAAFAITPFSLVARSQDRDTPAKPARPNQPRIPSQSTAQVSAAVPVAPAQPVTASEKRRAKGLKYVLFMDEDSTMMSGSSADRSRASSLRKGKEQMLWFRRDGQEYIVRDPAVLREVEEIYRPLREIGGGQAKIGSKQAEIGSRQAEIGEQQAGIGAKQAEIGARQAKIGSRQAKFAVRQASKERGDRDELDKERREIELEMKELEREMQELSGEMEAFNTPMDKLSEEMNVLSEEMNVLSRKMEEASAKAEAQMDTLLDRAISSGAATEVK